MDATRVSRIILLLLSFTISANRACDTGWFGEHCAYKDIALLGNVTTEPPRYAEIITDGNDTTCAKNLTTIIFKWKKNYALKLIRITVNSSSSEKIFVQLKTLQSGETQFLNRSELFKYGNGTFEIDSNDYDVSMEEVILKGSLIEKLCSFQIGGVCGDGWFGYNCSLQCPVNCRNKKCDPINGFCQNCIDGYVGDRCDKVLAKGSCDTGWFGAKCQYMCHCVNKECDAAGECVGGARCEQGWFGQACQHEDMAVLGKLITAPMINADVVMDGDDATCASNLTTIFLKWNKSYAFTWLRFKVKAVDQRDELTVMLKPLFGDDTVLLNHDYIPCKDQKLYSDGNGTFDVVCDVNVSVHEVMVAGDLIRHLCSLHISGGRNVALKQQAVLSSTLDEAMSKPEHAVDGNLDGNYKHGSCVLTKEWDTEPMLEIWFSLPVIINRIVILNRADCCQQRLKGFHLKSVTEGDEVDIDYTDGLPYPQNMYTVLATKNRKQISTVSITATDQSTGLFLSLCELQVFGESACQPGLYGNDCKFKCNCVDTNETCFSVTGLCPYERKDQILSGSSGESETKLFSECSPSKDGEKWQNKCPENCAHSCNSSNGICNICLPGFKGDYCNDTCPLGRFGPNCTKTCPDTCANEKCDSVNGVCHSCQPGYMGDYCQETCSPGRYGVNCTHQCTNNCAHSMCKPIDGVCLSCQLGYQGKFCNQMSTVCQEGWFGSSCQYKCHCATDRCHINGSCLENDICQTGWFGAYCQFQDLAVNGSVLLVPQGKSDLLQDGDDDTCHHNVNALLLTWKRNYVFSWLRIKMNETGLAFGVMFKPLNIKDTTLKNNDYIPCLNQKIYHNGNHTYYVHCNTSDSIHELFLVWQGPRTVCSLNVNAGRNVALKQVAELSSNLDEESVAGHAVDGNRGSCVHTKEGDPKPSLLIKFALPAIVDRIVIFNRVDCCQDRLKGFHLQTWTAAGTADIDYTDDIPYAQNIYNVVAPKNRKVITQISLTSQDKKNGLFLSICELEVYGDSFCPPKLYGAECDFICNCADVSESCDVSTGLCLSGCARGFTGEGCVSCQQGFYGAYCSRECSSGCSNHQCHVDTGKCYSCLSGYQGDFCNQNCEVGRFGESCLQTCPTSCKNSSCSAITGQCGECLEGFQGEFCQFCVVGLYGPTCNEACPVNCKHSSCNVTTGECYSCSSGYLGRFCNNTCPNGTFGEMCLWNCSSQCRQCNHITGYCHECYSGFFGLFCEKQVNTIFSAASLACGPGRYGYNCTKQCPENCANSLCLHTNGVCLSCLPGYQGDFCDQPCKRGYSGKNCLQRCPAYCVSCDAQTRRCKQFKKFT